MSLTLHPPRPGRYKYYQLRGNHCGIAYNETTGVGTEAEARIIKAEVEARLFRQSILGPAGTDHKFSEAITGYLEELERGRGQIGRVTIHALLGLRADGKRSPSIDSDFGHLSCRQVTQERIDRVIRERFQDAPGATVQRLLICPVNAVLTWAARREWCNRPWLNSYPRAKARDFAIDRGTALALVRLAPPHVADILQFLVLSGARVGEAVKLDWQDVDLGQRWLIFRDTKRRRKGEAQGEDRGVPIHRELLPLLAQLRLRCGAEGRVFRTDKGLAFKGEGRRYFATAWEATKKRAVAQGHRVEGLHVHDLRHTFATWAMEARLPQRVLDEIMGHATRSQGARYQHVSELAAIGAIDELPGLFGHLDHGAAGAVSVQSGSVESKIA
jgi:integrase